MKVHHSRPMEKMHKKLMVREKVVLDGLEQRVHILATEATTTMYVAIDGRVAGVVGVADTIRQSARQAVKLLQENGVQTVMLTGDSRFTANAVAKLLGMETVIAEVLPESKAEEVKKLQ